MVGDPPRLRALFLAWLPTALGSSVLVAEIPVVSAAVTRSAGGAVDLAALGLCISVIVVVNTPALALAPLVVTEEGHQTRRQMFGYSVAIGVAGAVVLAALATLPPLVGVLSWIFDLDRALTQAIRECLLGLTPASVAVALRRYLHGVLICAQRTGPIVTAAVVRIVLTGALAFAGIVAIPGHGALVGGLALTCGAFVEAGALAFSARAVPRPTEGAGTWGSKLGRHAQLAGARLLVMVPQLVTTVGIARSARVLDSLIVWPALYGLMMLLSGPTMDLESVAAAALLREPDDPTPKCLAATLTAVFFVLFAIVLFTPLAGFYLRDLISVPRVPMELGLRWAPALLLVPALSVVRAHLRGKTMATAAPYLLVRAAAVHVVVLVAVSAALSLSGFPGVAVGGFAVLAGILSEVLALRLLSGRRATHEVRRAAASHSRPELRCGP